ncbi:protein kinase domain-containing protein [Streptomyces litchfieldiae]|uniref:non-specific serine/threonine protein kinase n=1 Tax=Streptomyces litchfieldiae TaxID=3075543 RepID=A0ABU2MJ54_9ACTN|nr:protein kinase [Streptomyces sp. DSM 44938]MDT0341631.1 PQQ-binding-like beta-propeller repeat protein [Streptomyces sp. DSM 44938]
MNNRLLADRYRLLRPLGHGGMGEVWEAHDESLKRPVAVKVISVLAGGGSRGDEDRARFIREARITAALQHPNIVTVHDLGEAATDEGTTPFLVMELLRGQGLDALIRRGPLHEADVAAWGVQICDALGEAHAGGILHRDIKPANVLITASGTVKVLDFGIARAADPSTAGGRLTHTGFVVGTPPYMAPEQARGRPEPRSDLYALGCVLYEMLTGRLPFNAPDAMGYLTAHLSDEPPAPSTLAPGVSALWDDIIRTLLAKRPEERYGSAAALAATLRHMNNALPATAPHYAPTVRAPGPPPPNGSPSGPPSPRRGPSRRGLLLGGGLLAGAALLGGTGVVLATREPSLGPVVWSRGLGDTGPLDVSRTPAARNSGRCFAAGDAPRLYALDEASGERLWDVSFDSDWARSTIGHPQIEATPDTVFVMTALSDSSGHRVHALDAASGERLWDRAVTSETLCLHRPSGLVIVGGGADMAGVDPRTGENRWTADEDATGVGSVDTVGDLLILHGGVVLAGATGERTWPSDNFPWYTRSSPRGLGRGTGVLGYEQGAEGGTDLVFREPRRGDVVWSIPFQEGFEEDAYREEFQELPELLASGTTVFVPVAGGDRPEPVALDGLTGEVKWAYDGPSRPGVHGRGRGVAGGFLLPTEDGVVCLSAEDGSERWRDANGRTEAVGANGAYAALYRRTSQLLQNDWTRVTIVEVETGNPVWEGEFDATDVSRPVSGDGMVLLLGGDGTLAAARV